MQDKIVKATPLPQYRGKISKHVLRTWRMAEASALPKVESGHRSHDSIRTVHGGGVAGPGVHNAGCVCSRAASLCERRRQDMVPPFAQESLTSKTRTKRRRTRPCRWTGKAADSAAPQRHDWHDLSSAPQASTAPVRSGAGAQVVAEQCPSGR